MEIGASFILSNYTANSTIFHVLSSINQWSTKILYHGKASTSIESKRMSYILHLRDHIKSAANKRMMR